MMERRFTVTIATNSVMNTVNKMTYSEKEIIILSGDGNDFYKDTVCGFQNTPALPQRAKTCSALSFDRLNFLTWRISFYFLGKPLLCAIVFVRQ